MAAGGQDLEEVLKTYIDRGATDGMLKLTPMVKCFDAAKLTKYKSTLESSVWAKHQTVAKKCTVKQVATVIIDDTAAIFVGKKKSLKDKAPMDDPEVVAAANEIRTNIVALKDAKKATQKMDAATKRLTDTSKYTGAHKERFGADGQGKGIAGREEVVDGSGYVGNYKGQGTFDKK